MEFKEWPKIPRYHDSKVVVSKKLDGTNASICIQKISPENESIPGSNKVHMGEDPLDGHYMIVAGSRTKWISVTDDN